MPITVKLDACMKERKVSLTELAEAVGVTLANLSILKTGKAKAVRFSTLQAICRALDCQPGDLLIYEEGENPRFKDGAFGSAPSDTSSDVSEEYRADLLEDRLL